MSQRYVGLGGLSLTATILLAGFVVAEETWYRPYSPPCTERENIFEFTEKPAVKNVGEDRYEITFAVKGYCDATVGIIDEKGVVVRHLGSGVLGPNAPAPFQPSRGGSADGKNSLKQKLIWNGKDDLDWYVKEPGKCRVRVMLGLKPEFDKLLGATDPRNIPGVVVGLAVAEDAVYILSRGAGSCHSHAYLRKFDRDGNYLASLVPPPANMPWEKLKGMGWVEYEPGQRALQAPSVFSTVTFNGAWLPGVAGHSIVNCQPAVIGGRFYFTNGGSTGYFGAGGDPSLLLYIYTDGSTDVRGTAGLSLAWWKQNCHITPRLAASPDGKYIYMVGQRDEDGKGGHAPVVLRRALDGDGPAEVFVGKMEGSKENPRFTPGSEEGRLTNPLGIDSDAQGRVYVTDNHNNRLQVFSPEGKLVKAIPIDRPMLVRVHQKTGAIYVLHTGSRQGRSANRLTKLTSLEDPKEECRLYDVPFGQMALDSWSPKPRIWLGGSQEEFVSSTTVAGLFDRPAKNVTVWEEDGQTWRKILDFDQEVQKSSGDCIAGRWGMDKKAGIGDKVACDPTREQVYYRFFRDDPFVFDLKSGRRLPGRVCFPGAPPGSGVANDIAFDKRGYLHVHFDPGFYQPGVGRVHPDQSSAYVNHLGERFPDKLVRKEVPYDYGVEGKFGWQGIMPVKDQEGGKFFQDGMGVNMRGDVAEVACIYYIPKWGLQSFGAAMAGRTSRGGSGRETSGTVNSYAEYERDVQRRQKEGEEIYSIRSGDGRPLAGSTIWTFERTGELRRESAVTAPGVFAGVGMDEDGLLYFAHGSTRLVGGKPFLDGRGGTIGADPPLRLNPFAPPNSRPLTGTYIKSRGKDVVFLLQKATIPLNQPPQRPLDLDGFEDASGTTGIWVEGAEWFYAGASPVVTVAACGCPTIRPHLDWYKRSFVPESYRHSIGVLDTAGNLILHFGRYGNLDSGNGAQSRIPIGGDNIAMIIPRFISGTDNYLVFDDWGERLAVLKLGYHCEETAAIRTD